MDYKRIKDLLDKYFEGNTSIAEENELRAFFSGKADIPSDLEYAKAIFSFINEEKSKQQKKTISFEKSNTKLFYYISGIAASILIAVMLNFVNTEAENEIVYAYINGKPITDKNIAAEYSKQALLAVSQNLEQGTKNINYLSKFHKIETQIKNTQK